MPKLGIGIGLGTGGKKRIPVYKATGTGLSPDINGMIFYESGGIISGKPVYYSDGGFFLWWLTGANFWIINRTKVSGTGWNQPVGQGAIPTNATYSPQPGSSGTVTVVRA